MNNRGTYALLALFFAGLCGLWLADAAKLPTRRDRERLRTRVLPELIDAKPDDLRKIEILGGPEPMVFERRDGNRWQMTSPSDVAADPSKVESLAFNLKELARKPEADTLDGDPAAYGLAPPERTIKLWGQATDGPIAALEVGKTSLDRRYVRASGAEGVEVIDARGLDLLRLPPIRWRDQELFRAPSFEVDGIRLAANGKEIQLRRDPDAWRIVDPIRSLASEEKVNGLIADLGSLRVAGDSQFIADGVRGDALGRYGLKSPRLAIAIEAGRGGRKRPAQSIEVGKPVEGRDGQVYARRGDQDDVVALDARIFRDLAITPNAYRSPKVADVNPARVLRIDAEADGQHFEVARSGRDWTIVRPYAAPGDRQAIEGFLKGLGEIQTGIYLAADTATETGLDKPSAVLRIWQAPDPRVSAASGSSDPNGERTLSMKVGRRDAARKVIYAQIEGDSIILAIPDSARDLFPRSVLAFRDRLVMAVNPDDVERIAITGPGRKVALHAPLVKLDPLKNGPIGWWMIEPVTAPADSPSVGKVLGLLAGLRAESLVAETTKPEDLKKYGLDQPALTVTLSRSPTFSMVPPSPKTKAGAGASDLAETALLIGAQPPGRPDQRYARLSDRGLVFTLGAAALRILDAEFHDRHALAFDLAHAKRVHLTWPDRSFSMTLVDRNGRRDWSPEGAVDAPGFDPSRAGPLVKNASDFSTTRFLQYLGAFPPTVGLTPPRVTLRVEFDDGSPARQLRIGNPAGDGMLCASAATDGTGAIFLFPEGLIGPWIRPPRTHDDLPDDVFAR